MTHVLPTARALRYVKMINEINGFNFFWGTQKICFLRHFDLRTLLHLFHFIQVTISLISKGKLAQVGEQWRKSPGGENISRVSLKQPQQYSSPTPHTLAVHIDE